MIATAISVLFGLAAFIALVVLYRCLRSAVSLAFVLLAPVQATGRPSSSVVRNAGRPVNVAIFPVERGQSKTKQQTLSPPVAA